MADKKEMAVLSMGKEDHMWQKAQADQLVPVLKDAHTYHLELQARLTAIRR